MAPVHSSSSKSCSLLFALLLKKREWARLIVNRPGHCGDIKKTWIFQRFCGCVRSIMGSQPYSLIAMRGENHEYYIFYQFNVGIMRLCFRFYDADGFCML